MNLVEKNIEKIRSLCIKHKVGRLFVFGSVLKKRFRSDSDIDFIVEFNGVDLYDYADNYFDFKYSLEELFKTDRFELTAKDFAKLYGIAEDKAYQTLKEIAEQLFERYVIIDNPDPDEPTLKYTKTRWVSSIDYIPEKGKIAVYFAVRMLPYLGKLRGEFTKYKLEHIGKMTSIYAIRLYELLVQWQKTGNREVEIDWLKKQFEIEDGYERMFDLKKYVIDPAVADINTHSNYQVSWTQRKTGRRVTHFIFSFAEKQPAIPKPA